MLHMVRHSPFSHRDLTQALFYMQEGDRLLLWQDAVIAAAVPAWRVPLQALSDSGCLYVMREDLRARGLSSALGESITMEELVGLVAEWGSPQAW